MVAFRSVSNTTYAGRTNTTVTAPAGIQDGDWLLFFMFTFDTPGNPSITWPTGFNTLTGSPALAAGNQYSLFARAKLASSESGNYTATHASSTTQGTILCYSGGAATMSVTPTKNVGTAADSTALAVTTTVANSMLVLCQADNGDTTNNLSPASGFTERLDVAPLIYAADSVQAATGSSGNKTQTNNAATGNDWLIWLVCIDDAGGGGAADHPASKRFGGVPGMAFPGRGNVWAPYRRLIWPGHRILKPA